MHGSSEALLVRAITAIKAGTKHHHHSLLKLSSEAYAGLGVHHLLPWPHCGRAVAEVHDPLIWWMLHPQLPAKKINKMSIYLQKKNGKTDISRILLT